MAVVITLSGVYTPGPSELLTISGLNASAATLTVERVWLGVTEFLRDANTTYPSGGGAVIRDYEAPLGRDMTYRVTTYSSAGAVLDSVLSATISLVDSTYGGAEYGWIMDALDPSSALRVPLLAGTMQGSTFESGGTAFLPITSGLPVGLLASRATMRHRFEIYTEGADTTAFEAMIRRGGVLSVRPSQLSGIPHPTGVIRLMAGSVGRPLTTSTGFAQWMIDGIEVAPDAWPEAVPWATWDDWAAAQPTVTWADYAMTNTGAVWLDVMSGLRHY